jgi:hypothetical protein
MSRKYEPINGISIQMVHRNPRVGSQYVWPEGEARALADEQKARQRGVDYCDELRRKKNCGEPRATLEGWQVSQIAAIRVVRVENDQVVGDALFSWSFGESSIVPSGHSVAA